MNIFQWIVQIILGAAFVLFGSMKTFQYDKAKEGMPWVKDSSKGFVLFVGAVEILGGIGLIIPYALGIAPILTPLAAIGIAIIMLAAAILHVSRKENQAIGMNVVLLILALIVAIGRF